MRQAATSLNEDEEDPDTGVKLWLSTNLPTLVDKLALSNTTLQQVGRSPCAPLLKYAFRTWQDLLPLHLLNIAHPPCLTCIPESDVMHPVQSALTSFQGALTSQTLLHR